jgi:RNA polymerase subunit RPABC4/transcription elongation factor Spt4
VEKNELYEIINEKLLSLGITEDSYPLDPFKLAEAYSDKLKIDFKPFPTLSLGGLLYKDPEDVMSFMCINSLKSKKSQNFDIMHELCHYWLHPAGERLCYDSNFIFQNQGTEWQANEGAAQALMREKLFKKMYIYYSGNTDRLSDYFIVSKKAIEYRIKNLRLIPTPKLRGMLYKSKKARHCTICGNSEVKYDDNYCKICGEFSLLYGTGYKWSVYSHGHEAENRCPDCSSVLDQNARYCRRCGAASTLSSFLEPWYEALEITDASTAN